MKQFFVKAFVRTIGRVARMMMGRKLSDKALDQLKKVLQSQMNSGNVRTLRLDDLKNF